MSRVFIYGAGGQAKVITDAIEASGEHTVVGYVDTGRAVGEIVCGYPVLANSLSDPSVAKTCDGYVIALGDNFSRQQAAESVAKDCPGLSPVSIIHPSATIGRDVTIGDGTVILAGAIINPDSQIGKHAIINTKASVDHDNVIGDYASLAPGVTLGGKVTIDKGSFVGLGSNVIHGVTIGSHCVVGAGSLVLDAIADNSVAYGSPAKVVRSRKPGEAYL